VYHDVVEIDAAGVDVVSKLPERWTWSSIQASECVQMPDSSSLFFFKPPLCVTTNQSTKSIFV
jgi:hypothetical protein